jgi:hypothetical protein
MTKPSPVMNPDRDPKSFTKQYKFNIEKNPSFKIKVFKPPESDTKLFDYYYFTDVYIPK